MRVEVFTFLVAGAICVGGALGVVLFRNPVHNALSLVATLFGVAVLFIAQEAYFLAAIQVIVYAGAIVILFLFVIMLLGVDRAEALESDPFHLRRTITILGGAVLLVGSVAILLAAGQRATGRESVTAPLDGGASDVERLGRAIFTDYVFAFEITALLLTVAVVGAVVLTRRSVGAPIDLEEFPDGTAYDIWLEDHPGSELEVPDAEDELDREDDPADPDGLGDPVEPEADEAEPAVVEPVGSESETTEAAR
ncbi:MAG: NADH-quinone oxidoreductase subunit J [Actinobacteria bacterium]|nr:NADH-quinone oxidoreductase subunit J [Actinomycetota bacterium]